MGCGMSRSHLLDEGVAAFGSRNPFHLKTHTIDSPKLLTHKPPRLQKINSVPNSNSDPMWLGSPSFRVYVQSAGHDDIVTKAGDEQTIIHGGKKMICNGEVCVWGDSNVEDKKGGRFKKAFQVHRVAFWHSGPWHVGHAKPITKPA